MAEDYSMVWDIISKIGEPILDNIKEKCKAFKKKNDFTGLSETLREGFASKIDDEKCYSRLDNFLEKIRFFEVVYYEMENLSKYLFDFNAYFNCACEEFIEKYGCYRVFKNQIHDYIFDYGNSLIELYKKIVDENKTAQGVHTLLQHAAEVSNDISDVKTGNQTIAEQNSEIDRKVSALNDGMSEVIDIVKEMRGSNTDSRLQAFLGNCSEVNDSVFSTTYKISETFVDNLFVRYRFTNNVEWEQLDSEACSLSDIIDETKKHGLLFIEGEYGTGKTFLSKLIYLKLKEGNNQTYFYYSTDFFEDMDFTPTFPPNTYVFIDSFDMVYHCETKTSKLINYIKRIYNNNLSCHFIINMRPSRESTASNKMDPFTEIAFEANACGAIKVKIKNFKDRDMINNYLDQFVPEDRISTLDASELDKMHKHAVDTCKIPLFAFIMGYEYYKSENKYKHDRSDALKVYSSFVDSTIGGKFTGEIHKFAGLTLDERKYKELIQNIAIEMIEGKKDSIDYSEDISDEDKPNKKAEKPDGSKDKDNGMFKHISCFPMEIGEFTDKLEEKNKALFKNVEKDTSFNVWRIINNYFFTVFKYDNKVYVRFSDVNVLSYLASEYFYNVLKTELSKEIKEFDYPKVYPLMSSFELEPEMMDFLVGKFVDEFKKLGDDEQNRIKYSILELIYERYYLKELGENSIKFTLLLFILFLHVNDKRYSSEESCQHFFKEMQFVVNCAKNINYPVEHVKKDHRFLLERYFIGCTFDGCMPKRLNLKHYNFSDAVIKNTTFLQCKFSKNSFHHAHFDQVVFNSCIFEKQFFDEYFLDGNVMFKNCQFENVTFKISEDLRNMLFDNCILNNVGFYTVHNNLDISECTISDMKISDSKLQVYTRNNFFADGEKISGDKAEIGTNDRSCFDDNKSKIKISQTIDHFSFD